MIFFYGYVYCVRSTGSGSVIVMHYTPYTLAATAKMTADMQIWCIHFGLMEGGIRRLFTRAECATLSPKTQEYILQWKRLKPEPSALRALCRICGF